MKAGVVLASDLAASNNWGAKYHLLLAEHRPVVDELLAKFTTAEMLKLAGDLPFDEDAAGAVFCRQGKVHRSNLLEAFAPKKVESEAEDFWLGAPKEDRGELPRELRQRRIKLAVYVAAAAQFARNKISEELLEISKQKLAVAKRFRAVFDLARDKGADALKRAMARDPGKKE